MEVDDGVASASLVLCESYTVFGARKDVPPGRLVADNPAKVIKKIEEIECPLGFYKRGEMYSWRKK